MEGFATGFNLDGNTKPGYSVENEYFKVTFSGVFCDERKNIVSHGFECCYDWSGVMKMILEATEDYDSMAEVEEKTEKVLRTWLTSFQGWGLLSSMLPTEKHRYFILSLAYASANWNEATGGPYSTEKIFDTVKYVYENCPGKEIRHLLPRLGVWFEEIMEDDTAMKAHERMKSFTIFFNAKWMLEVKFVFEKKRVNRNLLDFAAEAVAQQMNVEDDIDNLEIPLTLFDAVDDKFKDVEWVRSYWNFKAELENAKSEIDEEEIAAIVEEADEPPNEGEAVHVEKDATIVSNEEVQQNVDDNDVNNENIEDQKKEGYEPVLKDEKIENFTDTLDIASLDLHSTDDGLDIVSGWGALYIFMVIFAYLCV